MITGLPFEDIRNLVAALPEGDAEAGERAAQKLMANAGADPDGRAVDMVRWLARWAGPQAPLRPLVTVFGATHAAMADNEQQGVAQRLAAIENGQAAVCRLCAAAQLGLKAFELALPAPVRDQRLDAALGERDAAATMAFGMEAMLGGVDLMAIGDVSGAGFSALAIVAALHGLDPVHVAGQGGDAAMASAMLAAHPQAGKDPLEALRILGGRETSAIAGAILAARVQKAAVILSGTAAIAAAAVLQRLQPGAIAHCRIASPGESAVRILAETLGLPFILDTSPGVGETETAALAAAHVRSIAAMIQ